MHRILLALLLGLPPLPCVALRRSRSKPGVTTARHFAPPDAFVDPLNRHTPMPGTRLMQAVGLDNAVNSYLREITEVLSDTLAGAVCSIATGCNPSLLISRTGERHGTARVERCRSAMNE
ncbi:MAG: hypothetical protein ACK5NQ_10175 [Pseudomonas sp.]